MCQSERYKAKITSPFCKIIVGDTAEYIEREAAYEDFEKCNSENPKWTPSRVKALIARQKSADVAQVRHGRWSDGDPYCPICRKDKFRGLDADVWSDWKPDYCPNCGAKMGLKE